MIKGHMFVLAVPDLERSSAFYRDVRRASTDDRRERVATA